MSAPPSRLSRLCFLLLIAGGLVQVGAAALSSQRFLARLPSRWVDERQTPNNPVHAAVRVLPRIASRIPAGARVLLVTAVLERIPYEMHFLLQEFRQLTVFPDSWLAVIAQHDAYSGWHAVKVRERMAKDGRLWSPDRLAQLLPFTDFVVVFEFADPAFQGLSLVTRIEDVALYKVDR